jgi:hypothetical protein
MACTPTHCTNNSTGTTTCISHRATCSSNRTLSWTDAVQGGLVDDAQVEELRSKLVQEIDTYNAHANYNYTKYSPLTTKISAGGVIDDAQFNAIRNTESQITSSVPATVSAGSVVDDAGWDTLISAYNVIRQNCICNSDCSCNAVCTCHGDCGCNYSDMRLKTDIIFEGVINGLKIYSFKYIWNKFVSHRGVMAQDLIGTEHEHALTQDTNGYYMVNYTKLPSFA